MTTLVGSVMGYALDKFLNTSPWLLVMGVFFGATAGCLSAYRWAQGVADNNSDDKSD